MQSDENDRLDPTTVSADVLFDVLAEQRRRYVLHCLREHATSMTLSDVADEVAALEHETPVDDVPAEAVERIYLSLYHSHVPKLADANVVEYDPERDTVALAENVAQVERYVENEPSK